jgi:hypothetical protein
MAQLRAVAGGQTVGGKFFKGGQFITNEAIRLQMKIDGKLDTRELEKAVERASYKNIGHALASIRKTAIESVVKSPKASTPGTPIHTKRGFAKRSIGYQLQDKWGGFAGFDYRKIGQAMSVHEHGGRRKKQSYPKRPTMLPALLSNLDRFAESWRYSIGPGT